MENSMEKINSIKGDTEKSNVQIHKYAELDEIRKKRLPF